MKRIRIENAPKSAMDRDDWFANAHESVQIINSILHVMQYHCWELTWYQLPKCITGRILQEFLQKIMNDNETELVQKYISYHNQQHFANEFRTCYMDLRKMERLNQRNKIWVDQDRFIELERKVELLWFAPGMPGMMHDMEELQAEGLLT